MWVPNKTTKKNSTQTRVFYTQCVQQCVYMTLKKVKLRNGLVQLSVQLHDTQESQIIGLVQLWLDY